MNGWPTPRDGITGGKPAGTPEAPDPRDTRDKQESIRLQLEFGKAMAAAGYRVEWIEQPSQLRPGDDIDGAKKPEMRLGDSIADVTAPWSASMDQVRKAVARKVAERQAYRVLLDLIRTPVTRQNLEQLLARRPIEGLQELFIREQGGAIYRVLPDPALIAAAPRPPPLAAPR